MDRIQAHRPPNGAKRAGRIDRAQARKERLILVLLGVALLFAIVVSMGVGRYGIPIGDIFRIIGSWITGQTDFLNNQAEVVIVLVRIPRILLCVLVGAALSASGAAFQGLFKNPMVSPDVLGVSSGAGVGASIAILMDGSSLTVQLMAFLFGIGAVLLVMGLASAMGRGNPQLLIMVLAGMVIGSLFSSCNALIKYVADSEEKLADITFWLMGSFAKCGSYKNVAILTGVFVAAATPLFLLRWQINVMAFGEEEAQALGVNTRRVRMIIIVCATMLTASSIAMCGMVGWVGLTMPHITRLMVGPNYKVLLPTTMLSGALFLVLVDDVARTLVSGEIPIGVITSIVGAPIFIYLLFKGKRGWV